METAALDVLECLIEANEIFPRSAAETAERLASKESSYEM